MTPTAASIVFLDRDTLSPDITLRPPAFPHTWTDYPATRPDQVVAHAAEADIVISNKVPLRRGELERLPRLKMIAVAATGYDMFDIACCRERGIVVANVRGYSTASVAEHTFALILALKRNLVAYGEAVRAHRWEKAPQFAILDYPISDLAGGRLGIIGKGSLGEAVAGLGRAFGMTPVFAARKAASVAQPPYTPWEEVLATSDVISLHCPLTAETRGLIAWPEFLAMKRRPLLINTARGGIVDEADLGRALKEGVISGAGFDVAVKEPPDADSPLMRLVDHPNCIVTPHVAWASHEAQTRLAHQLIDNIEAFVAGNPANVV
ncbi:MAG: D-2-hydroxyacid dehydrogenase [Rhodospirillales bacterium]